MNVNSIRSFNPYNSTYKNNYSFKNSSLAQQSVSDTVSFTGLPQLHNFNKVNPLIRKSVSALPVSKTLQKQAASILSNLENFVKKGKVWVTKNMPADATENEKRAFKAVLSLVDLNKINNGSAEDLLKETGQAVDFLKKVVPEEFSGITPALEEMASLVKDASKGNLSDIETLDKFDNILAILDKFCETGEGTDIALLRISSKFLKAVSDIARKQALSQNPNVLPVEEKANVFKACTGFLKDTKNIIEQSPEREEIVQAFKDISSTKL